VLSAARRNQLLDLEAGETAVRYRLEVRLTPADVGKRVVIRWRRPSPDNGEVIADVLGILEEEDPPDSFAVRTSDGQLVVIPHGRALAGKVVPPAPPRRRHAAPSPSDDAASATAARAALKCESGCTK
jgi:hypothetical protein